MDKNPPEPAGSPKKNTRTAWVSLLFFLLATWGMFQAFSWWQQREALSELQKLAHPGDIVMFSSSTCVYCVQASTWLNLNGIAWQACNVDTDAHCRQLFQAQGAPGTPLFLVRGQWQLGFSPARLAQALAPSVLPTQH